MKTKIQKASAVLPVVVLAVILYVAGCKGMGSGSYGWQKYGCKTMR